MVINASRPIATSTPMITYELKKLTTEIKLKNNTIFTIPNQMPNYQLRISIYLGVFLVAVWVGL